MNQKERLRDIRKALNKYFMRDPTPQEAWDDLQRVRFEIGIMLAAIEIKFAKEETAQ